MESGSEGELRERLARALGRSIFDDEWETFEHAAERREEEEAGLGALLVGAGFIAFPVVGVIALAVGALIRADG